MKLILFYLRQVCLFRFLISKITDICGHAQLKNKTQIEILLNIQCLTTFRLPTFEHSELLSWVSPSRCSRRNISHLHTLMHLLLCYHHIWWRNHFTSHLNQSSILYRNLWSLALYYSRKDSVHLYQGVVQKKTPVVLSYALFIDINSKRNGAIRSYTDNNSCI